MRTLKTWIPVLAIAFAALVVVGCGGGGDALSEEEYQERLDSASQDLREASSQLGPNLADVITGGEDAGTAAAESVGQVADQLRQAASDLEDVDPPANAEQANEELVNALRAYADDLGGLQEPLESGDLNEVRGQLEDLDQLDSVQELQEAAQNLQEAGYTFGT